MMDKCAGLSFACKNWTAGRGALGDFLWWYVVFYYNAAQSLKILGHEDRSPVRASVMLAGEAADEER
jgi:hypothetical protein